MHPRLRYLTYTLVGLLSIMRLSLQAQEGYTFSLASDNLLHVLEEAEKKLDIQLAYDNDIQRHGQYSITLQAPTKRALLDSLWTYLQLDYQYASDTHILLRQITEKPSPRTVHFTLRDQHSQETIPHARIHIVGLQKTNYTDSDGNLTWQLPQEELVVEVHMMGYQTQKYKLGATENHVNIEMTTSHEELSEILIEDREPIVQSPATEQHVTIRPNDAIAHTVGIGGADFIKQLQLLPGVAAHNDSQVGLEIRGAEDNETLIILDHIPIYNTAHYYGILSAINTAYIEDAALYKNNIPIAYGGKTAGMLELRSIGSSDKGSKKYTGQLDANLLFTSAAGTVLFSDKWQLSLAGRMSNGNIADADLFQRLGFVNDPMLDMMNRNETIDTDPNFQFNDWNGKLQFAPNAQHHFAVNFYHSEDSFNEEYAEEYHFKLPNREFDFEIEEEYLSNEDWSNTGTSLSHTYALNNKLSWHNSMYYTRFYNQSGFYTSVESEMEDVIRTRTNQGEQENNMQDGGIKSYLDIHTDSTHQWQVGVELQAQRSLLSIEVDENTEINNTHQAVTLSSFVGSKWYLPRDWQVEVGGRLSYFSLADKAYFSPRIFASKRMSPHWSMKASLARQYQFVREINYESRLGRNFDFWQVSDNNIVPPIISNNIMLGLSWKKDRWLLDAEMFYRHRDGVVEFAPLQNQLVNNFALAEENYRFFTGDADHYGIDMLLAYSGRHNSTWLSYTWSRAYNAFPNIFNNESFSAPADRPHQLKWVYNHQIKDWQVTSSFVYSSGQVLTDFQRINRSQDRRSQNPNDRLRRLRDYIRWDIGLSRSFQFRGIDIQADFSVFNVLDRTNVNHVQYIVPIEAGPNGQKPSGIRQTQSPLLPRTFNVGLTFKF